MSGRSGYGRSKIVGKLINLPANMMMAGLAPRVGKPGWAIRLYWQRVDECFCGCYPCILDNQVVALPPVILPPLPLPPSLPPQLPPPYDPVPPGPGLPPPPSKPGFGFSSSQLPGRNGYAYPGGSTGSMAPFATRGGIPSEGNPAGPVLDGNPAGDDADLKSGGHYVMAQFNREVSVLGGGFWGDVDISWNNFGTYIHGASADTANPIITVKYKKIAADSPVYKVGFGGATPNTTGAATPGSYNATAVYLAYSIPFAAEDPLAVPYGANPTKTYGMEPYQWLLFDIEDAMVSIRNWDGVLTDYVGQPANQGQWPPTDTGRKAADDYARNNSVPTIQYDPTVVSNVYDEKLGLLYVNCADGKDAALGPLAPFNGPMTSTLIG